MTWVNYNLLLVCLHWQIICYVAHTEQNFILAFASQTLTCSVVLFVSLGALVFFKIHTHTFTHISHNAADLSASRNWVRNTGAVRGCKLGIPHLNHTTQLLVLHGAWTCVPLLLECSSQLARLLLLHKQILPLSLCLGSVHCAGLLDDHVLNYREQNRSLVVSLFQT